MKFIYGGERLQIGFILVKTAPIDLMKIFEKLKVDSDIDEVNHLSGDYDLIVRVEVKNSGRIGEIVVTKIRALKGVIDTKTLTSLVF